MKRFDLIDWLTSRGFFDWMPDAAFLKLRFRKKMGRTLDLKAPKTFNEKLQWLKLYDRRPVYTRMVDKALAKEYVAEKIGPEYIIPTLGLWNSFDEIDFDALPDRFVLKCTHDSGGLVICRDKAKLDKAAAKAKIERSLKRNYYMQGREWPYKDVKPRILAEAYMEEAPGASLRDYKLFCADGRLMVTLVCSERFSAGGLKEDFYDADWNRLALKRPGHDNMPRPAARPACYNEMIRLAGVLSRGVPFVRVDFFEVDGRICFGELTFFPAGGMTGFEPAEWDRRLGDMIALPAENAADN